MSREDKQPDYTIDDFIDRFTFEQKDLINQLYSKESQIRSFYPEARWEITIETINKYINTGEKNDKKNKEPSMTTLCHNYHCPSSTLESHYYLDTSKYLNKKKDFDDSEISLYDGRSPKCIINFIKVYQQAILSKNEAEGMVLKRIPLDDCFKCIFAKIQSQLDLIIKRREELKTEIQIELIEIKIILACNTGKRESVQLSALLVLLLLRIRFIVENADFKRYINDWIFSQEREDALFKKRLEDYKAEQKRKQLEQEQAKQEQEQAKQEQEQEQYQEFETGEPEQMTEDAQMSMVD